MKSIETAPNDKLILLLIPEFGSFTKSWWTGSWSFVNDKWSIRTPFTQYDKQVIFTEMPDPIGWEEFPAQ